MRIFIVDGREFPDPDPRLKVDEVRQHFMNFYPELFNAESKESKRPSMTNPGETDTIMEFTPMPYDAAVHKAAQELVAQVASQLNQKTPASREPIPIREVVDAFLKSAEPNLKPRSLQGYTKELVRFAKRFEYLPDRPELIEEYMARGVKGREYASTRRAFIRSILNSLYEFVIARRQPDFPQVMRTIKVRKVKHGGSNLKWDELSRVMDVATDPRDIAMLHLGIGQGFRPCEEMVRLNVEDVLEDRIYVRGKERDEWAPLLPEVRDSLRALMNGKGEKEAVFISQWKRRLSADMAALRIKALLKKAEIRGTNRQRPYILRHTFATLTRAVGCDKASVDALMRQRTEDVSAFYDHRSDEEKLQLLEAKLEQYSPLRRLNGRQAPNSNKSDKCPKLLKPSVWKVLLGG